MEGKKRRRGRRKGGNKFVKRKIKGREKGVGGKKKKTKDNKEKDKSLC